MVLVISAENRKGHVNNEKNHRVPHNQIPDHIEELPIHKFRALPPTLHRIKA